MNKATPVTIGGRVFYLEDDGYEQLRAYLNSLRALFDDHEGRDEIMADIESRIAEILSKLVASGREEAISVSGVIALMDTIGRPEDLSEKTVETASTGMTSRRLFRDTRGGMLAGVCAGIGRYLDTNPNLVRVVFVLASLAWGIGVLVYVVLWIVIPVAQSSSDRLTMDGVPFTLGGLANLSSPGDRAVPARTGLERIVAIPFHLLRRLAAAMSGATVGILRSIGPFVRRATGSMMVAGAIVFLATITLFTLVALTNLPANYLDPSLMTFLQQVPRRGLAIVSSLALLIPGVFVLAAGVALLSRKNVMQPTASLALLAVWFFAVVTSGALWLRSTMRWQAFEQTYPLYQTEAIVIEPVAFASFDIEGVNANVRIVDGLRNLVTIEGRRKEIEQIDYALDGTNLRIRARADAAACVICDEKPIRVTIASPTPDSIVSATGRFVNRDYAAERERMAVRRQERIDAIATAREVRDSILAEQTARRTRLRELQDSLDALR